MQYYIDIFNQAKKSDMLLSIRKKIFT